MDEKPSTSDGITCHLPLDLTHERDPIAASHLRESATPADLDDNQRRWLVVGIGLHTVILPIVRQYVESILTVLHDDLIRSNKIDTQTYQLRLRIDPRTYTCLNYEVVNNNKAKYGMDISKYDYTIKNAVDLSKLFVKTHLAQYTGFDETCDSSVLLGLILDIANFSTEIKADAADVRNKIRNSWAHCNFTNWNAVKYSDSFQLMKKLVNDLKLSINEEKLAIEKLEKWETNGQCFLSGSTHGFELVNEIREHTHDLAVYARSVATGTDANFMRIQNELEKFEICFTKISQLDKKLVTQDKTLKKHETQIENLRENLSKCACHDSHNMEIAFWEEQDVMFVQTPVVTEVSEIIESQPCILIVGEPGIGKSMLLHHVALQLHNHVGYIIIPCPGLQDIHQHYKKDTRQMLVLDDIFGRYTVSVGESDYFHKNEDYLKRVIENGKTKIVATCRLDIYKDDQFHAFCSLFTSNIFNLSTKYSQKDRLTISTKYLSETNIQLLKDQNESFTPLMCFLYSKNENFNLNDFFHCPYEAYRNEWEKLQSIDPYKYCALFLCVVFNGTIKESSFDIHNNKNKIKKTVLNILFDICGIDRGTSLSKMKGILDKIIGTYLRKTNNEYRVIHDKMFDFMCYYFGNKDTHVRSILWYAKIDVVNERTQLESINATHGKFTIIVPKNHEQDYFERIQHDLKHGRVHQCFSNAQIKLEKYRAFFLKVLMSLDNDELIRKHIIHEIIITSCLRGYADITEYCISMNVDLDKGYHLNTPLTAACSERHEKIVQLLINKGCDVNQMDVPRRTPLIMACRGGNEKIVKILIDAGCDVKETKDRSDTPLRSACLSGNETIVQQLINKGCDVNQVDTNRGTPLTGACRGGNEKIVQLIIDKGGDVNQKVDFGETPLTASCRAADENILQLLINQGADVNQMDGSGETPLMAACEGENEKIVQLLITNGGNLNQDTGSSNTLLTCACIRGSDNVIQLLIDNGCDVNQIDEHSYSPLTAACVRGKEKIVQSLIYKGCDVKQVDGMGRRPLAAAYAGRNNKIIQLLKAETGDDIAPFELLLSTF